MYTFFYVLIVNAMCALVVNAIANFHKKRQEEKDTEDAKDFTPVSTSFLFRTLSQMIVHFQRFISGSIVSTFRRR